MSERATARGAETAPDGLAARLAGHELAALAHGAPARLCAQALLLPLGELVSRPGKQTRARLVELAYAAAGGAPGSLPPELPLAIEALHAGSLIIDDIEDGSETRRGAPALHCLHGIPLALNAANWLYFFAQDLLRRAPLADAARLHALERMTECLLRCHEGQALDLGARVLDLPQADVPAVVRAISACKTGALVSFALELGALAAGAGEPLRAAFARFGCEVGIGVQMLDDLSGLVNARRRDKAVEDLRLARPTWLWAWVARDAEHELYERARAALVDVASGADPEPLLASLRFRCGGAGRARARRQLEDALAALAPALGNDEAASALSRQLRALEAAYAGE